MRTVAAVTPTRQIPVLLIALVAALALAATAQASSIVFIKGGDVWLAKANGTGQRALTKDGTAGNPYRSPAYSDSGLITAVKGRRDIHFFDRRGKRVRKKRNIGGGSTPSYDPIIVDHAISPNGRTLASTLWLTTRDATPRPGEPQGTDYGTSVWYTRTSNGRMAAPSTTDGGQNVTWTSNKVPVVFAPNVFKSADAWVVDLAEPGNPRQWFQDQANPDPGSFSDGEPLDDGELTRGQDKIAVVRGPNTTGSASPTSIRIYNMTNLVDRPTELCDANVAPNSRKESPSWSPDGRRLIWSEADGIYVSAIAANAGACDATRLIAGGSQPDWGPANVPKKKRKR